MVNAETPFARIALPAMLLGALAPALIPATVPAASRARPRARSAVSARALRASRELWATINVCNAPDQPDTVGIRGSMPGDGRAHDTLYMRFHLQYLNTSSKHWVDLANAATGFVAVGSAKAARQGGGSFQLVPVAGRPAFTLRGVVNFQWHRGASVLTAVSRATSAGRQSLAGADPAGFSAATCQIG